MFVVAIPIYIWIDLMLIDHTWHTPSLIAPIRYVQRKGTEKISSSDRALLAGNGTESN